VQRGHDVCVEDEESGGRRRTPGGSDIVRHDPADAAVSASAAAAASSWRASNRHSQLLSHYERHLGPAPGPLPGFDGDVELYVHGPTGSRPFLTVTTIGMSDQPASVPPELADRAHQELLIYLPALWDVAGASAGDAAAAWPFRLLTQLAALPRQHATFFAPGHTLAMGDRPAPFHPSTLLSAVAFVRPGREAAFFGETTIDRQDCRFLWVVPITLGELQFKLDHGFNQLLNVLSEAKVPYAIDPARACAVTGTRPAAAGGSASGKRRRWWKR
jgi:hypothetical protein